MSLIVLSMLAAAAAGLSGALAARVVRRRRAEASERAAASLAASSTSSSRAAPAATEPSVGVTLSVRVGEVVQYGDETRWPKSAIMIWHDGEIYAGILLALEAGQELATVAFGPPRTELLWLHAVELPLPATPPSRVEIEGKILDRRALLFVQLESAGEDAPAADPSGSVAFYDGTVGDAAVVLYGAGTPRVYYGAKLDREDYQVLGKGVPSD